MTDPAAVVLDASAVIEIILATPTAREIARSCTGKILNAPAHLDLECVGVIAALVRKARLTVGEAEQALARLSAARVDRWALTSLTATAWAARTNLSVADAYYHALAVRLDAELHTCDQALADHTPGAVLHTPSRT
ncbi:MAG: type II toxin-antitoxin system VapC family toxin [Acidimicrobiales bacterium]